jgi:hypothetical protein
MENRILHITNGDILTEKLEELQIPGEIVVWREMLCEGPALKELNTAESIKLRKSFLKKTYNIPSDDYDAKFVSELKKLKRARDFDQVVLWFEFDLFCHINMLAAISFFMDHHQPVPMSLVCSKKLEGETEQKPLSSLSLKNLKKHYEHRISLNTEDLEIASLMWELYCSSNPLQLKKQIKKTTNFEYLSSCIRAHIERFPNSQTGLNSLEKNILKIIDNQNITSLNQLLGYALQYQGYYGYSDLQMQRLLQKLNIFYVVAPDSIKLNEQGQQALAASKNFYRDLKNEEWFGGAKMYDFLYDPESHSILKL